MEFGITFFVIMISIIAIWILIEIKRLKHKVFAVFLILLILFTYISFSVVLKNQDINVKTVPGAIEAGKLYFSWMGSMLGNLKSITMYAIKKDWKGNETTIRASHR